MVYDEGRVHLREGDGVNGRAVCWHSLPADFTTKEKNISTYPRKGKKNKK